MAISDNQKTVLKLLADGQFHSGTELANMLGVSRSAIWKQLNTLPELGLQYSAVRGKGYRLDRPLELLSKSRINAALAAPAQALISTLEIHDQIDSTNRYLLDLAQQNADSGRVCFAEQQTAGKGRRGRQWVSPFGSNIYLSILWRFQQGYAGTAGLSLAIGVAVIRALQQQQITGIGLKWPNDIYSQSKKLGGILIEISGETDGPCAAIIGLGLNLFLSDADAKHIAQAWTDLSKISHSNPLDRNRLAGSLLNELLTVLKEYESIGISAYLDEWRRYDCLNGQPATLFIGGQPLTGIVRGVDHNGLLVLEHADGRIQAFASGEVSFNSTAS